MKLWEKHRDSLSEDVKKQIEAQQGNIDLYRFYYDQYKEHDVYAKLGINQCVVLRTRKALQTAVKKFGGGRPRKTAAVDGQLQVKGARYQSAIAINQQLYTATGRQVPDAFTKVAYSPTVLHAA
ncbi:hypothetical protein TNCV_736981 [Trichonephila clavipes]|nr:hypothetical protein TNCV_736981 [Trichonephila clavipes]